MIVWRTLPLPTSIRNLAVSEVRPSREVVGTDREVKINVTVVNAGTEAVTPKGVSVSASEKDGAITLTAANLSYGEEKEIELSSFDEPLPEHAFATTLEAAPQACNTFEEPDAVKPSAPAELPFDGRTLRFRLPAAGVVNVVLRR